MRKILLWVLTLWLMGALQAKAQMDVVVADIESGVPLRDVKIYTDSGSVAKTDYRGMAHIDRPFSSATVSHPKYLSTTMQSHEMVDTIFLLPRANTLNEVVVWGESRKGIKSMVSDATKDAYLYAPPPAMVQFDFFEMFRKKPLNSKARKKNRELLDNWDRTYNDPLYVERQQRKAGMKKR
ncbi:MAG: hypothetical protein IKX36_00685 [Prevotella sp.]|nr:hypothetical protein [Prevotella sp.]